MLLTLKMAIAPASQTNNGCNIDSHSNIQLTYKLDVLINNKNGREVRVANGAACGRVGLNPPICHLSLSYMYI